MLRFLLPVLLLLAAPSVHARYGYVPLETVVDRAAYVMHLKVVAIEQSDKQPEEWADGGKRYAPDYAVCEVKELLFGLITTDTDGHVRVTSDSPRNTVHLSLDASYSVGDEITLIASSTEIVENKGMVFSGRGHPHTRRSSAPTQHLRKLLRARMDHAGATLGKFDKLLPGARDQALAAVIEHEDGQRKDYLDLSPEADLLLDLVATNRGAPAEAKSPRNEFDATTIERLRTVALRAICDISEAAAATALPLLGGDGHGAEALLAPGDIKLETALTTLLVLDELGELGAVLPQLVRQDVDGRAMEWSAQLVLNGGHAGKLGEWIWIEHLSNEAQAYRLLARTLAPPKGPNYPYASAAERTLARLIDAEAWALIALCRRIDPIDLPAPTGKQPNTEKHEARVKALGKLHEQAGFLAVYTFLRAIMGKDNESLEPMRERIKQQERYQGDGKIDLDDFAVLEARVRQDYGSVPTALEVAIKNAE